jgi:Protein of unknown function (DUF736)
MATIGSFKKSGNEFQGEIVTLSVQAKGVRIVPETNRTSDNAPSHRVRGFMGSAVGFTGSLLSRPFLHEFSGARGLSCRMLLGHAGKYRPEVCSS